jgi:hypothetical protein
MFPPYRIPLDRGVTRQAKIETAKFKFRLSVWTPLATAPVVLNAALDTFSDYSILPTDVLVQEGQAVPPMRTPAGTPATPGWSSPSRTHRPRCGSSGSRPTRAGYSRPGRPPTAVSGSPSETWYTGSGWPSSTTPSAARASS